MSKFKESIQQIKKNILAIILVLPIAAGITMLLASQICLVETTSNSIPYSWCLQIYNLKPEKDDLCAFNFRGRRFIKYLVGTEGDEIRHIGKVVYVGGTRVGWAKVNVTPVATVASVASVTPGATDHFTQIPEGKIPKGYVFMAGTHEDSFDSRYKEFGLVPVSDVKGKVFGVIKYKE